MHDDDEERDSFVIPPDTKVLNSKDKPCLYKDLGENEIPRGVWACEMDGKQVYISVFNLGNHQEGSQYIKWKELIGNRLDDGWELPTKEFFEAFQPNYENTLLILAKLNPDYPRYFTMWSTTPYKEGSYWVMVTNLCCMMTPNDTAFSTHVGKAIKIIQQ